jgi:hypothetical protein
MKWFNFILLLAYIHNRIGQHDTSGKNIEIELIKKVSAS